MEKHVNTAYKMKKKSLSTLEILLQVYFHNSSIIQTENSHRLDPAHRLWSVHACSWPILILPRQLLLTLSNGHFARFPHQNCAHIFISPIQPNVQATTIPLILLLLSISGNTYDSQSVYYAIFSVHHIHKNNLLRTQLPAHAG
jgi:predicted nucleic acid binding AN1-type Zn finger protein